MLLPGVSAPSGAYAMVGMGGAVAAMTRGPLTGMMMVYELSGNYAIILPLMVTCTLASALCHVLVERTPRARERGAARPAAHAGARARSIWEEPVAMALRPRRCASGCSPRRRRRCRCGTRMEGCEAWWTAGALGERWRQAGEAATVEQLLDAGPVLSAEAPVSEALATLDAQAVEVLAVEAVAAWGW